MLNFDQIKTFANQAWDKTHEALTGIFGIALGSVLTLGVLSIGLTLGLMALGLSVLVMLIALPLGGLLAMKEKPADVG